MRDSDPERRREILKEAFTAGWQAGLAKRVTDPRALAVIETCFDLWLQEAGDEEEVLGLAFRRRVDLPAPARQAVVPEPAAPARPPGVREEPVPVRVPRQRRRRLTAIRRRGLVDAS